MADSVLSTQNIEDAKAAIAAYITTCDSLFGELQGVINGLTAQGADFNGQASDGYMHFFLNPVTRALTDNLTAPGTSISHKLVLMLDGIGDALLGQADPALGRANIQAGGDPPPVQL